MIKRRGSIMPAIFDFLYREFCRARLAEMRKQLLISVESHEVSANCDVSHLGGSAGRIAILATMGQPHSTKLATFTEPAMSGWGHSRRSLKHPHAISRHVQVEASSDTGSN
jgi:hypothetical protein